MSRRTSALTQSSVGAVGDELRQAQSFFDRIQGDTEGFQTLSEILKSAAGINLPVNVKNQSLMASRVSSILKDRGLSDYRAYAKLLRAGDPKVIAEFVHSLTTNTTQFFRESQHFDILSQRLPELIARKQKDFNHELRIWCAAASTGQEPYTIAMTIAEALAGRTGWDVKFLATDIDLDVLGRAAKGLYSKSETSSLPATMRQKYFQPARDGRGQIAWQVVPQLRKMIRFAPLNLIQAQYPFQHKFDIVFCRNVLIYFDAETASSVVEKLANTLTPGGYLFLGHSETGTMRSKLITPIAHAAYQRKGG